MLSRAKNTLYVVIALRFVLISSRIYMYDVLLFMFLLSGLICPVVCLYSIAFIASSRHGLDRLPGVVTVVWRSIGHTMYFYSPGGTTYAELKFFVNN